jgi:endonuclease YncB( thermonuclease family)
VTANLTLRGFGLLLVCIAATSCAELATGKRETVSGRVTRVIDGDSLKISGVDADIRLWGLDAPEWNEPGGSDATAALRKLALSRRVVCDHMDTDRYDRFVGRCSLPDGRDIAAEMIAAGAGVEYCYYSKNFYQSCK